VNNAENRARGLALADAGVHYAMLMLSLPDPAKRWRGDGMRYAVNLPGGRVALTIADEGGKIDLNAASEQTLRLLLDKLTGNDDMAAALTDKIMDWRDGDDLKRLHGAEAKDYRAEGKGYVPQNKNFQALQDGVNPQKASAEVLQWAFGLDAKAAADFIALRQASPPNAPPPPLNVPPGGIRVSGSADAAYSIQARSQLEDGPGAGIAAILRRQFSRDNGAPFAFVSWQQQIFGGEGGSETPPPR
jgi:general secretion pathway protein K